MYRYVMLDRRPAVWPAGYFAMFAGSVSTGRQSKSLKGKSEARWQGKAEPALRGKISGTPLWIPHRVPQGLEMSPGKWRLRCVGHAWRMRGSSHLTWHFSFLTLVPILPGFNPDSIASELRSLGTFSTFDPKNPPGARLPQLRKSDRGPCTSQAYLACLLPAGWVRGCACQSLFQSLVSPKPVTCHRFPAVGFRNIHSLRRCRSYPNPHRSHLPTELLSRGSYYSSSTHIVD